MLPIFKNQRINSFLILCLTLALTSTGCKKLVEIDPPRGSSTAEVTFSNNAQANSVLAGLFATFNTSSTLYAGLSSDELVGYAGVGNELDYQFSTNKLLANNLLPSSALWTPLYKTIYNANVIIDGVNTSTSSQLTPDVRKVLTGEAKFVRAYTYFYLTNFFGDVPLALTSDYRQNVKMSRTPQAEVYKQIVADLLDAQALLPADYTLNANERIHPIKGAATALLARVYLYQKNWKDAETQATALLANTTLYGLVTPLKSVFLKNSKEAIFQLQPNTVNAPYGIQDEANFTPLPPFIWTALTPADQAAAFQNFGLYVAFLIPPYDLTPQLANSFEPNDQRKAIWTGNTPSPNVAPYNGVVTYYCYKYYQPMTANSAPIQYQMVLRVAEQYLIRAEARAQQGNTTGAAADVNAIRLRAGLGATPASSQADLLTAIAQERRVEFFGEWGHRFFDLKRTGKAGEVLGSIATKQPWSDLQLLYPIPPSEIVADPSLIQNPGY